MSPTVSQASSKPPVYPKNGESGQRSPSMTRNREPVKKTATDSGLKKRSQSQEVSTGTRSLSRSAKSVSTISNPVVVKSAIESRDEYKRTAHYHDVRYQNGRLNGKPASHGKSAGPLKAFPINGITSDNDTSAAESVSSENLLVDLNGNFSPMENPEPKNRRRCSTSEVARPLPVFTKPDVMPSSKCQTNYSDRAVTNGSVSKRSGPSRKDSSTVSIRSESQKPKSESENRKTSVKSTTKENKSQDVSQTFERISLNSTMRNAKPQTSVKSELPDVEVKGETYTHPETETRKGSNPKYTRITEKSVRLGVNGRCEVLGGRSPDPALRSEVNYCQSDEFNSSLRSRSRKQSIGLTKDSTKDDVSLKPNKSEFRTETFVLNVDQSLESGNDITERNCKVNKDLSTKPSSPSSEVGKSGKAGVVGLQNLGNTCFMNSILQCLSNTRLLLGCCLDKNYERDINRPTSSMKGKMIKVYADLMTAMWRGSQSSISPSEFKSEISNFAKQFVGYREQDAHEFLVYLLEALHEDVNRVQEKRRRIIDSAAEVETISAAEKAKNSWKNYLECDDSKINDIFVGQLKSTLRCPDCSYVSNTFEPFLALSLPLKKVKTRMSLVDCFKLFTQEEVLDYENQPKCAKCGMQKSCTKKMSIHRFPKVLIIHLMRFKQGSSTKLTTEVSCPLHDLDLSEFATAESPPDSFPPMYDLYAVSNHSGSLYSGHYTAYAKNPDSQQWHLFNDRQVSAVSLPKLESGQPYLLFYERQGPTT